MRGIKRCQRSTGRMRKHRDRNEFKVTAVKIDNGHMAPCFHTMKADSIRCLTFATFTELEVALTAAIRFYNHHRLHSGIE